MSNRASQFFWLTQLAAKEATYGAGIAPLSNLNQWFHLNGASLIAADMEEDTDEDEAKGFVGISESGGTVTAKRSEGELEYKLNIELFPLFLKSLVANISTSGVTDYTHLFKQPAGSVQSPHSFNVVQATDRLDTSTFFEYRGIVANNINLSLDGKKPWQCTVGLKGDGSELDASAVTAPSIGNSLLGTRLLKKHTTLKLGPLGTEDVTDLIRELNITLNGDLQELELPSRGELVGRWDFAEKNPMLEAEVVLAAKKGGTLYSYWRNRDTTKLIFDLLIENTATKSIRLQGNSVRVKAGNPNPVEYRNGIEQVVRLPLRFEYNVTDASHYIWTVKNQTATYLA